MFKREHHLRIVTVLQSLNAEILRNQKCYFGGGTAIVLLKDEYRESVDIDFLCSDLEGYRILRQRLRDKDGLKAVTREGFALKSCREIRTDQYGIRTMLAVGDVEIKFEIVFEGGISLDIPDKNDHICNVPTLTKLDMAASKLLANSDRWADQSVYGRDLIDLSMLDLSSTLFKKALAKASKAYGENIRTDLAKAIEQMRHSPDQLKDCMNALKMTSIPRSLLWDKIRKIEKWI
ncbi:MAG: nucleotidyl transferase AbiEii/AbiGii toxin family protein [Bdellovibrionota bacterium]